MKTTPVVNHEETRTKLLQKLERMSLRVALRAMTPQRDEKNPEDIWNAEGMPSAALDALEVASTARALLEGKPLPVRTVKPSESGA